MGLPLLVGAAATQIVESPYIRLERRAGRACYMFKRCYDDLILILILIIIYWILKYDFAIPAAISPLYPVGHPEYDIGLNWL